MERLNFTQTSKVPYKKYINKSTSANKITKSTKNLFKTANPSKRLPKNYDHNHEDLKNLYLIKKSHTTTLKNLTNHKIHNINCSNPQIRIRKTMPCAYRSQSSIQLQKQLSLSSKQKPKAILSKQSKLSRDKVLKLSKGNQKIGGKIMKNIKIKQHLSHDNYLFQKYPIKKPSRIQRKTTEEFVPRQKTCSKKKVKTASNQMKQPSQIKSKLNTDQTKLVYLSKSSCITRNISTKNSKQKDHFQGDVGEKFQKKRGNGQKKLKKQAVYTSMKISRKNSLKFLQTGQDHFVVLRECYGKEGDEERVLANKSYWKKGDEGNYLNKKKNDNSNDLWKCRTVRKLDFLKAGKLNGEKPFVEQDPEQRNFSFRPDDNSLKNNAHEISIDNFLECNEQPFHLQSQQNLKQRLSQLSLQRLREHCTPNPQQLQCLSEFQSALSVDTNQTISPTFLLKNPSVFPYPPEKHSLIQRVQAIDWISILASTMLLKTESFHLAVGYFDAYSYGVTDGEVSNQQFRLVAIASLTLAIKMNERELEHEIFNAYSTLQVGFTRDQIVQTEQAIAMGLRLNLNFVTLSFWVDYLTCLWDSFLDNLWHDPESQPSFHFRSLHSRSYQNYRRALEMCNCIVMDASFNKYPYPHIALSIIFLICEHNMAKFKQVFAQIDNFSRGLNKSRQSISQSAKQNIPTFATQQTLDELSQSGFKEHSNPNGETQKSDTAQFIDLKSPQTPKKLQDPINFIQARQKFVSQCSCFVRSQGHEEISCLEKVIEYVREFWELKLTLQVDPRVYEQAETYEDFMQFHSYCPHAKLFILKRIDQGGSQGVKW